MIEIDQLGKTFALKKQHRQPPAASDPRHHSDQFHALSDVSFTARGGAVTGLLGSNGAGKTTLLRILATALQPTHGTASIDGIDIVQAPMDVRRRVGFLSGNTGLYGRLSPHELLTFFGRMYGIDATELRQRIAQLCEELKLTEFAHRRCELLSAGMKQRVSIARSVIHRPSVMIFDEPTTGLDVASAQGVLSYVEQCRAQGKTILFSTHHMHEVERLCDWVVIMRQGRTCFAGTVQQMRERSGRAHLDDAYLVLSGEGVGTGPAWLVKERLAHVG